MHDNSVYCIKQITKCLLLAYCACALNSLTGSTVVSKKAQHITTIWSVTSL